jgi:hypothetical protein
MIVIVIVVEIEVIVVFVGLNIVTGADTVVVEYKVVAN